MALCQPIQNSNSSISSSSFAVEWCRFVSWCSRPAIPACIVPCTKAFHLFCPDKYNWSCRSLWRWVGPARCSGTWKRIGSLAHVLMTVYVQPSCLPFHWQERECRNGRNRVYSWNRAHRLVVGRIPGTWRRCNHCRRGNLMSSVLLHAFKLCRCSNWKYKS